MKGTTLSLLAVALVASAAAKQLPQPQSPIAPAAAAIQENDQPQAFPSDLVIIESEDNEELVVAEEKILLYPNGCPVNPYIVRFIPDRWDCRRYYQCDHGRKVHMHCAADLHFNRVLNVCDWPERAGCVPLAYSAA